MKPISSCFVQLAILGAAFLATSCSSQSSSNGNDKQSGPTQTLSSITPSNTVSFSPAPLSSPVPPNAQGLIVIREQGDGHAALFATLPDQPGAVYTGASLPTDSFTGGQNFSGTLNASVLAQMFNKTSSPMSAPEKQQILNDFNGAMFVYFEDYTDSLCSNQEIELDMSSTLGNYKITEMFKFVAIPQAGRDCKFLSQSVLALIE